MLTDRYRYQGPSLAVSCLGPDRFSGTAVPGKGRVNNQLGPTVIQHQAPHDTLDFVAVVGDVGICRWIVQHPPGVQCYFKQRPRCCGRHKALWRCSIYTQRLFLVDDFLSRELRSKGKYPQGFLPRVVKAGERGLPPIPIALLWKRWVRTGGLHPPTTTVAVQSRLFKLGSKKSSGLTKVN